MLMHNGRRNAVAVTPSDTVGITECSALYIGTTGDVTIITPGGQTVTLKTVPVGMLEVKASYVKATGTTATNIVAFY
jgi:hypothetical protein